MNDELEKKEEIASTEPEDTSKEVEEKSSGEISTQAAEDTDQNKAEEKSDAGEAPKEQEKKEEKLPGMKWYVVHTYSGYENKAKEALQERIKSSGMQKYFGEILVPQENVVEIVKGKKRTTTRKFFPGYILVNMIITNETWYLVKNTPRITGFVGGTTNPPSISEEEVARLTRRMTEGAEHPRPKVMFEKGDAVRVIDGPFNNFNGVVDEVKPDKGKLRVLVSIFGRATPIELDFIQVEKN